MLHASCRFLRHGNGPMPVLVATATERLPCTRAQPPWQGGRGPQPPEGSSNGSTSEGGGSRRRRRTRADELPVATVEVRTNRTLTLIRCCVRGAYATRLRPARRLLSAPSHERPRSLLFLLLACCCTGASIPALAHSCRAVLVPEMDTSFFRKKEYVFGMYYQRIHVCAQSSADCRGGYIHVALCECRS